ncbi:MAG: hypothetical protein KGO47_04755, partial [Cyanobacteria bacterium REEB417]|nr:hypothetical protein [Cyanobacteria bacterium REEB417]
DQLRDQIGHAPIALGKWLGVVVIANTGMLEHPLQVTDQRPVASRRNRRLVQMQGTGKGRLDRFGVDKGVTVSRSCLLHEAQKFGFAAGDRRSL